MNMFAGVVSRVMNLPSDMLHAIFRYLQVSELFKCKTVCKSWNKIVFELWPVFFKEKYKLGNATCGFYVDKGMSYLYTIYYGRFSEFSTPTDPAECELIMRLHEIGFRILISDSVDSYNTRNYFVIQNKDVIDWIRRSNKPSNILIQSLYAKYKYMLGVKRLGVFDEILVGEIFYGQRRYIILYGVTQDKYCCGFISIENI